MEIIVKQKDGEHSTRTISLNISDEITSNELCEELYNIGLFLGYAPTSLICSFINIGEEKANLIDFKLE